jgi:hypothetical protein
MTSVKNYLLFRDECIDVFQKETQIASQLRRLLTHRLIIPQDSVLWDTLSEHEQEQFKHVIEQVTTTLTRYSRHVLKNPTEPSDVHCQWTTFSINEETDAFLPSLNVRLLFPEESDHMDEQQLRLRYDDRLQRHAVRRQLTTEDAIEHFHTAPWWSAAFLFIASWIHRPFDDTAWKELYDSHVEEFNNSLHLLFMVTAATSPHEPHISFSIMPQEYYFAIMHYLWLKKCKILPLYVFIMFFQSNALQMFRHAQGGGSDALEQMYILLFGFGVVVGDDIGRLRGYMLLLHRMYDAAMAGSHVGHVFRNDVAQRQKLAMFLTERTIAHVWPSLVPILQSEDETYRPKYLTSEFLLQGISLQGRFDFADRVAEEIAIRYTWQYQEDNPTVFRLGSLQMTTTKDIESIAWPLRHRVVVLIQPLHGLYVLLLKKGQQYAATLHLGNLFDREMVFDLPVTRTDWEMERMQRTVAYMGHTADNNPAFTSTIFQNMMRLCEPELLDEEQRLLKYILPMLVRQLGFLLIPKENETDLFLTFPLLGI